MEYAVANLFMAVCLSTLAESGRLRANEKLMVPVLSEMREKALKCRLLRPTRDCAIDPVSAVLAFLRDGEIDWAALDCVG